MKPRLRVPFAMLAALASGAAAAQSFGQPSELDLTGIVTSLLLVVGLILGAAYMVKRSPFALTRRTEGPLSIVAALPIGPKERLLLVEARGREVLLAVSPAGIAILGGPHYTAPGPDGPYRIPRSPDEALGIDRAAAPDETRVDGVYGAGTAPGAAAPAVTLGAAAPPVTLGAAAQASAAADAGRPSAPMTFAERLSASLTAGYRALVPGEGR
jgi:flagellar protein FliO/FliZ